MYVTRVESMVLPGRVREFEAFAARAADILKGQPGFLRGGLANSAGTPAKYISLAVWESQAAGEAARRSDAYQTLLAATPLASLATIARPLEAFEIVHRVLDRDIDEAGFVSLWDITIDPTKAQVFEDRARELLDLVQKFGHGLISNSVARFLGGGGRYLAYLVTTNQETAQTTVNGPEVQAFMQAHPLTEFGGVFTGQDAGAVLQVVVPALVA